MLTYLVLCHMFPLCYSIATLVVLDPTLPSGTFSGILQPARPALATATHSSSHFNTLSSRQPLCPTLFPAFTFSALTFLWRWFFLKMSSREVDSGCRAATAAAVFRNSWWSSSKQNREAAQRLFQSHYWLCCGAAVSSRLSFPPYVYRQIRWMDWDADRRD